MTDDDDGLADLLAGVRPPDVYRWHALDQLPAVCDRVEAADWRFAHLGGWTATSRLVVLGSLGRALALPAHYGHNLDALHDCLREVVTPTLLVWDHWARFARPDPAAFRATVQVLGDRARRPVDAAVPAFAVLLWGEGPPTGVGSLD